MTHFTISVVSDSVCPWCYVGKKKLDAAIKIYQNAHPDAKDTFTTTWLPFQLNPAAPTVGVDKMQYYKGRLGKERASMMLERVTGVGKEIGINFNFGGKTGNSRDSHRLIHLGKLKGPDTQNRVVDEVFKSFFENQGDITSHEMLQAAGVKAGLDALDVKEWLNSDKGGPQVDREVTESKMRGISGVPNFVMQGKYEIGGAQDAESFVRVFERIKQMEQSS